MKAHEISKEWVARMTTLVECWNKLDGNVGELSSWVNTKVPLQSTDSRQSHPMSECGDKCNQFIGS